MKKVLILGNGISAKSAICLLKALNKQYICLNTDDFLNKYGKDSLKWLSFCIVSPGIPLDNLAINHIQNHNKSVISEIEFASRHIKKSTLVMVTGTDGKTTTTKLIKHLLGNDFYAVGNVGNGFAKTVAKNIKKMQNVLIKNENLNKKCKNTTKCCKNNKNYICEVSSFQAESFVCVRPKIAVLLNLAIDHLSRHKTFENYINAKLNIFKNQTSEDFAVLNADDENVMNCVSKIKSNRYYFSLNKKVKGCFLESDSIYFRDEVCGKFVEEKICNINGFKLKGSFNLQNLLAAVLVCCLLGKRKQEISNKVKTFKPLKHRFSFVGCYDGVEFYNSSKATNVHSALSDMQLLDKPACVIVGGSDKGESFDNFIKNLPVFVKCVIVCGDNSGKFVQVLKQTNIEFYICENMQKCIQKSVNYVKKYIKTNNINLNSSNNKNEPLFEIALIPACASHDKYKNFEHRGEVFESEVRKFFNEQSFEIHSGRKQKGQV